jgi:hypothetical protein
MITHFYRYMYVRSIFMSNSERLSRLDLKIYEVGHQEYLVIDGTSPPTKKIINHKYNVHVKYMI